MCCGIHIGGMGHSHKANTYENKSHYQNTDARFNGPAIAYNSNSPITPIYRAQNVPLSQSIPIEIIKTLQVPTYYTPRTSNLAQKLKSGVQELIPYTEIAPEIKQMNESYQIQNDLSRRILDAQNELQNETRNKTQNEIHNTNQKEKLMLTHE